MEDVISKSFILEKCINILKIVDREIIEIVVMEVIFKDAFEVYK